MYKIVLIGTFMGGLLLACGNKKQVYRAIINERKYLQDSSLQLKFSFIQNVDWVLDSAVVSKDVVIEGDSIWVEYKAGKTGVLKIVNP